MKTIPIFNSNLVTLVDDEDYEKFSKFQWYLNEGYARRSSHQIKFYLHSDLLRTDNNSLEVDHINGNKLDNQKSNLRLVTRSQNSFNKSYDHINKNRTSSKYRGVYWDKLNNKWKASIRINGRQKHLGLFEREEDAAEAFNRASLKTRGAFSFVNTLAASTQEVLQTP